MTKIERMQERVMYPFRKYLACHSWPRHGVFPIFESTTMRRVIESYLQKHPEAAKYRKLFEGYQRAGPDHPTHLDDMFMVLDERSRQHWD